ncbi:MAG: ribbon-helix-helix protein, CopG family [Candidatus Aenigmarchaeota archaeon]|nr:ribbon-helix-helix protein, CopG family [Candidatus Aenigmarchaeota archaeon]
MDTIQIRLTGKQIRAIDRLVQAGIYPNRSEAIRDAVRKLVKSSGQA